VSGWTLDEVANLAQASAAGNAQRLEFVLMLRGARGLSRAPVAQLNAADDGY
jgi:hypothetical protein